MPLTIKEAWLPATLTAPALNDEEFGAICAKYPDFVFETTGAGKLVVMKQAVRNASITAQLRAWPNGGTVFDSWVGFILPNGARRSAHTAWVAAPGVKGFRFCPEFVIELRSPRDKLALLREKMSEFIENGARLVWLLDPERRVVEVLRPGFNPEVREGAEYVEGEGPVAGFVLDLRPVWDTPA